MSLTFAFKKLQATEAIKEHITKKVAKFQKLISYSMDIHVIVSMEKMLHCAEINCFAEHRHLVAMAKTKDLYESIDLAAHKIEGQLKKYREKKKGHATAHMASRLKSKKLASDVKAEVPHRAKRTKVAPPSMAD